MSLQREINRIEQIARTAQIACAGLEGAEEKAFNLLHPRGPDGRFGGSSKLAAPVAAKTFRSDEIDDVGMVFKSVLADFGESLKISERQRRSVQANLAKANQSFRSDIASANRDFPLNTPKEIAFRSVRYAGAGSNYLTASFDNLKTSVSSLAIPIATGLLDAMLAISFTPASIAHVIVGRDAETAISEKVAETLRSIAKAVEPVTSIGVDAFETARELFDRAITDQLASDPDTTKLDKKAKAKAFDSAVADFNKGMENDSLFAPLVKESAARLLIGRLTKLGDRKKAEQRVADISLDSIPPGLRAEVTEIATDMHQLIGQDLHIKLINRGSGMSAGRGYAIPTLGAVQIAVGGGDMRSFLFHELGHFTDAKDLDLNKKVQAFVSRRITGPLTPMKKDFPNYNYGPDEVYYPDNFINPYIGKSQGNNFSEVMSMGIETFAHPETLRNLAEKDPQHMKLVLDHIRSQYEDKLVSKQQQDNENAEELLQELWRKEKAKNRTKAAFLEEQKDLATKSFPEFLAQNKGDFNLALPNFLLVLTIASWKKTFPEVK